ncbi:hypothetical protein [Cetobacterium sp. ZOR0034]|uniref:hypothetical protein n=1 Tax=Cetobacterium sp. ZOR0034 TaxID=1339239 RepID=UPI000648888E|nr:hypothetical protein [Cetobacterium sp. ZOR0034]
MYKKKFSLAYAFDLSTDKIELFVPVQFSLLEDSNVVLEFCKRVLDLRFSNRKQITINFSKCILLDVAALSILNTFLLHLRDEANSKEKNIVFKTTFTGKTNLDILIYKVGIITLLKLENFPEKTKQYIEKLKLEIDDKNIKTLPLLAGGGTTIEFLRELIIKNKTAKYISDNSKFGTEVVRFVNECLETVGYILNLKGNRNFKGMIGELATNSLEHLGEEMCQLYCTGYYIIDKNTEGEGSIVFFNFGNTIYESLLHDSTKDIKEKLSRLSKLHYFDDLFTEENLWTLAALQPKISRKYDRKINNERGTGTIKLLEGFKNFSSDKEKLMTIVSGKTQILFDNSKISSYNDIDKRVALNEENSLETRPSSKYLKNLKHSFPGTIIYIQFSLSGEYLKKGVE